MLTVLNNGRPDSLPCQVHGWMPYYLKKYLGGMDQWQAFEKFGMDFAIYVSPEYKYDNRSLANWRKERKELGADSDGNLRWEEIIITPKGDLHHAGAWNDITGWETEYPIKNIADFEIWDEFYPVPIGIDFNQIRKAKDRLGERGVIRSHPFSPGQGSPWQSFCILFDTEHAILLGMDEPETAI
jgi:hypothetical protein